MAGGLCLQVGLRQAAHTLGGGPGLIKPGRGPQPKQELTHQAGMGWTKGRHRPWPGLCSIFIEDCQGNLLQKGVDGVGGIWQKPQGFVGKRSVEGGCEV